MTGYEALVRSQTKHIIKLAEGVTIDAGASKTYDVDVPPNFTGGVITERATYDASASNGISINTYYSQDGSNFDTQAVDSLSPDFSAGDTLQQSFIVALVCQKVRIEVVNNDGSYAVTLDYLWIGTTP